MKRLTLFLAGLALSLAPAYAQDGVAEAAAEVRASVAKMQSPRTPCNGGKEAFRDFSAKFSTDSAFMASRLRLAPAVQEQFAELLVPASFTAREPYEKTDDNGAKDWFYQFWGPELQFAKVYLTCSWVDSFYTHVFEWTRLKDGLWYLTNIDPGE